MDTYISQLKQLIKAETKGMHFVAGVPVQERNVGAGSADLTKPPPYVQAAWRR